MVEDIFIVTWHKGVADEPKLVPRCNIEVLLNLHSSLDPIRTAQMSQPLLIVSQHLVFIMYWE